METVKSIVRIVKTIVLETLDLETLYLEVSKDWGHARKVKTLDLETLKLEASKDRGHAQKVKTLDLEILNLEASKDRGHIEEEVSTTSGIRSPNDEFEIAVCGYMPRGDGKYLVSVWNTIKVQDPDPDLDPERPYSSGNVTINKKPLYSFSEVRMMYKTKQHVAVGSHLYSLGGLYPVSSDGDSDSDSDGDIAHPFESKRYCRVWRLDVNRPSAGWKAVPPMTFPNRYDPPSVALQGKLYVLGGFFKSQFPAEAKELGWMEAYDPISNTWEPLPNPPSGFFLDADPLIFTALESKNQILVARYNHDDLICDSATFCIYDVITRSWTKLEPPVRKLFARYPDRTERRSIAVGNTLYWGLLEDEDIIVQAYELDRDIWIHGRFNIRPFVAKDEFLAEKIFPASPPLLHLNNQRFCLFFLTSCFDRSTCQVSNLYLNCLILDISPINDEGKPHEQHDYYDHACYRVIDEEDSGNINYHVHVHDHFWRLNISIVSIQKYPLVNPIQLWDTVLLKQKTGFSKRKRICAGCNTEIGHGRFLSCMDAVWHPACFRCHACNLPINDHEFSTSGKRPYHKSCYKEQHHPRCDVDLDLGYHSIVTCEEEDESLAEAKSEEDEHLHEVKSEEDEHVSKAQLEEEEQLAKAIQESLFLDSLPLDNRNISHPYPFSFPSGYRTCAGCNTEIGQGQFLSCMDAVWHPACFRCHACNLPINDHEFSMSGKRPYHKSCYKEQHHPKCDVCKIFIPTNSAGIIEYRAHPFWMQKYCPSHEHDRTPRCCSCERMEPRDTRYLLLDDGRKLCFECLDSAVMDTYEGQPLYLEIQDFYEGLHMKMEQQVPMLLVERQALNEAMEGEKNGHHHMPGTRGLCLSEEQTVTTISRRPRMADNQFIDMITEPRRLIHRCEITAILVLYGLPRLLTGSILAHEMMHAWLRLKGYPNLSPEVEEGICQVMAHMWLDSEIYVASVSDVASSSVSDVASSLSSSYSSSTAKKGKRSDFEKELCKFFKLQIETDTSPPYGDGFKKGNGAVLKYGLKATLDHIRLTGSFPS